MFYLFLGIITGTRSAASRTPDWIHEYRVVPVNPLLTLCARTLETISLKPSIQDTDRNIPFETIATSRSLNEITGFPDIVLLRGTIDYKPPCPLTPLCALLTACRLITLPP